MSSLRVRTLNSLDQLRSSAPAWDNLWRRSPAAAPTARAELVALWSHHFASERPFCGWLVEQDGQAIAALPLTITRRLGCRVGQLPGNAWSNAGELLLDPACDTAAACEVLVEALARDLPLLSLPGVARGPGADDWRPFFDALDRRACRVARRHRFQVPVVRVAGDWESYFAARSRNHRRQMRKAIRLARQDGDTQLTRYCDLAATQVEPLLRCSFEVEARGWKGAGGSAVLTVRGIWDFYLAQAQQLARWEQLEIIGLEHRGQAIACEYGWRAGGRYASLKVGYDEAFARYSPGQLLRMLLLEELLERGDADKSIEVVDFHGPATAATAKWATDYYDVDKALVALGGAWSRLLVSAYRGLTWAADRARPARLPAAGQPPLEMEPAAV